MVANRWRIVVLMAGLVLLAGVGAPAQDKDKDLPPPKDRVSDSRASVTIAGQKVDYTVTAGQLVLREEDGKPLASIFYVAYNRVKVTEPPAPPPNQPPGPVVVSPPDPARPITFAFNGGPGSSSVWLHLGAFGPKRVALNESGEPLPPPPKLIDNDLSILDFTDLVFIDPVSTGFSRAAPGVDAKRFHGVQEDLNSIGDFIHLYLTRNNRWGSPKYIAGESYGTTRAAALVGHLQDQHGIDPNGVILISSILNFGTARFDDGNDLPYALYLPSYTATAWYHRRLPGEMLGDLKAAVKESEEFANSEYPAALFKGDMLSAEERSRVAKKLSRLTGLSEDFITRANFRVEIGRFTKELLRDQGRTIGRFDGRLKGTDSENAGDRPESDPSYSAVQGAYTASLNQYVRRDLHFETDLKYEVLTGRVNPWDFGAKNTYLNVAGRLGSAMRKNAALRVYVASGYFDLATPFMATDYTLRHLGLDAEQHKRITVGYYEAGHMMYIHRPSLEKMRQDLAAFFGAK
ncbi:MAG: S10 family peptidase [Gemmataceae bacterium]